MRKVAGVVVTYNRLEKLKKNIEGMLKQKYQLEKIYVVDNCSTDETCEYMKKITETEKKIEYIRLDENLGGSKGFEVGVKKAYEDDYDCIWGMDDDAFPREEALEKLMEIYDTMPEDTCLWSNPDEDKDFKNNYKKVKKWIFVGFFVPRCVIEKIGYPRGDLFIYGDDDEYCHRILKKGYHIFKVRDSIIDHKSNLEKEVYEKNILGKKIQFMKVPDWRLYYVTRNAILKYKYNEMEKYKAIFFRTTKRFIKIILFNPKQIHIFLKACFHGIIGKSGKVVLPGE